MSGVTAFPPQSEDHGFCRTSSQTSAPWLQPRYQPSSLLRAHPTSTALYRPPRSLGLSVDPAFLGRHSVDLPGFSCSHIVKLDLAYDPGADPAARLDAAAPVACEPWEVLGLSLSPDFGARHIHGQHHLLPLDLHRFLLLPTHQATHCCGTCKAEYRARSYRLPGWDPPPLDYTHLQVASPKPRPTLKRYDNAQAAHDDAGRTAVSGLFVLRWVPFRPQLGAESRCPIQL